MFGASEKFQNDPHWRDLIPFYEYFHGDNGPGIDRDQPSDWLDRYGRETDSAICKLTLRKPARNGLRKARST